jgi:AcrR family transcriptional regulator
MADDDPPESKAGLAGAAGRESRPRDAERTKLAILRAAEAAFSTVGYTHTGIREIATDAGVDRALIARYFGSKQALFEAVLKRTLPMDAMFGFERSRFGHHAVAYLLNAREDSPRPIRMMVLAAADPAVREVSMTLNHALVIEPMAAWLGPPNGRARATNLVMLWAGFFLYWRLGLPSLKSIDPETRRWLETATQAIVDGAAGGNESGRSKPR